ncbi:MAG: hypothetical protein H6629_14565 [Calditrichae bacterium]|nr:hypothetical protein [Calditrichia bacterium]
MRKNGIIPMLLFCFTHVMLGQETIRIDLQINTNYEQRTSISLIEFGEENRAATEIGMAPGGIQVTKTDCPTMSMLCNSEAQRINAKHIPSKLIHQLSSGLNGKPLPVR